MPIRRALLLGLTAFASLSLTVPAVADEDRLLSRHKDWEVHKLTREAETACYALSKPKKKAPKGVSRGDTYFLVTNWPARDSIAEPSIVAGFTYREGSSVQVSVGKARFKFFTQDDGAWIADPKEEQRFLAALRGGAAMVVKATSARGTVITDHYSLSGSGVALDKIAKACK